MNGIQLFENPEFGEIRTVEEDGRVLFCAADIAKALGYTNTTDAVKRHCRSDGLAKRYPITDQLGRTQVAVFIPEPDVYRLVTGSHLQNARRFEAWIFEEVLPSIRRDGAYISGQGQLDDAELIARALQASQRIIDSKQERIEELEPKALFADSVADSGTLILIRDMAHILSQNGIDTGERKLFRWLRDHGYMEKHRNEPTQMAIDLGVLQSVESVVPTANGCIIRRTPKVTGKGQDYFVRKFLRPRQSGQMDLEV